MRTPIASLRACICAVLAIFALTRSATAQEPPKDSTRYGIFAGLTLVDHSHAPFIGGTMTHSNAYTSIVSAEFIRTISAVRYNGALRLTKPARFTIAALFGPEVEAPEGDLFGPDKISYLMLSSGLAITLHTKGGPSFTLAALYMTPDGDGDPMRIVFAGRIPI